MILVSPENRAMLIQTLESHIPSLQDGPYRDALFLMLAMLHDYQMLEAFAQDQIRYTHRLTAELTNLCTQLCRLLDSMGAAADSKSADAMIQ